MTPLTHTPPLLTALAALIFMSSAAPAQAPYDDRYSPIYRQGRTYIPPATTAADREYQLPDRASAYARARQNYFEALNTRQDAQNRLAAITSRMYRQQLSSGEARQAFDQLQQARQAYHEARQEALQPLGDNPQFQEAQQRADRIDQTIDRVRYQPGTTQGDIVDLSEEQLEWAERAGRYKTRATDSPEVQRTRREMVDAYIRLQQIQQQTLTDVRDSSEVQSAQAAVRAANSNWYEAREQLAGTRAGYDEAVGLWWWEATEDDGGRYAPWMYRGVYDTGFGDGLIGTVDPVAPDASIGVSPGFSGQAPSFEGEVPSFGTPGGSGIPGTR